MTFLVDGTIIRSTSTPRGSSSSSLSRCVAWIALIASYLLTTVNGQHTFEENRLLWNESAPELSTLVTHDQDRPLSNNNIIEDVFYGNVFEIRSSVYATLHEIEVRTASPVVGGVRAWERANGAWKLVARASSPLRGGVVRLSFAGFGPVVLEPGTSRALLVDADAPLATIVDAPSVVADGRLSIAGGVGVRASAAAPDGVRVDVEGLSSDGRLTTPGVLFDGALRYRALTAAFDDEPPAARPDATPEPRSSATKNDDDERSPVETTTVTYAYDVEEGGRRPDYGELERALRGVFSAAMADGPPRLSENVVLRSLDAFGLDEKCAPVAGSDCVLVRVVATTSRRRGDPSSLPRDAVRTFVVDSAARASAASPLRFLGPRPVRFHAVLRPTDDGATTTTTTLSPVETTYLERSTRAFLNERSSRDATIVVSAVTVVGQRTKRATDGVRHRARRDDGTERDADAAAAALEISVAIEGETDGRLTDAEFEGSVLDALELYGSILAARLGRVQTDRRSFVAWRTLTAAPRADGAGTTGRDDDNDASTEIDALFFDEEVSRGTSRQTIALGSTLLAACAGAYAARRYRALEREVRSLQEADARKEERTVATLFADTAAT